MSPARLSSRAATVAVLETSHPGDMRALNAWLAGHPDAVPRCVLGKTEGNGCVNDFTRGYTSHVVAEALGLRKGDSSIIMSGGTEGVLTPHLLIFADESAGEAPLPAGPRLSLGVSRTRVFAPFELGRRAQIEATCDAVLEACKQAGLEASDLCFAQVKCPLLTPERVAASAEECATTDGYYSMGLSRGASALGVALATGELSPEHLDAAAAAVCADYARFSSGVASASAGVELMHSEILVLGNAHGSRSALRAAHCVMRDSLDLPAVHAMFLEAGLEMEHGQLTPSSQKRVRCVLAKADPAATVRGQRTTMQSDSDLHATRHARAAVGGVLGGLTGMTLLYVSGGGEHQGPQGGGPCCVIFEA
ncbi:cyanuric acid hydrolase/Barbiturase [Pelagophyceae sp. CCMP2097]|nr:cyanuric acid hydrolase/Barbiturase [Pelagophyceae sp. CCMP2097]